MQLKQKGWEQPEIDAKSSFEGISRQIQHVASSLGLSFFASGSAEVFDWDDRFLRIEVFRALGLLSSSLTPSVECAAALAGADLAA